MDVLKVVELQHTHLEMMMMVVKMMKMMMMMMVIMEMMVMMMLKGSAIISTISIMTNKGIGDAGSTADLRMLWSAIVCLGLL